MPFRRGSAVRRARLRVAWAIGIDSAQRGHAWARTLLHYFLGSENERRVVEAAQRWYRGERDAWRRG